MTVKQLTTPVTLLFTFIFVATAAGQTSKITATLEGTVTDTTGGVVPSAEVRLRNTATNQTRSVRADDQGFFRVSELPVGTYEVRVDQSGFAAYLHTGVTLTTLTRASRVLGLRVDIRLSPTRRSAA